ncbi:MAG: VIT1/CCC1 transporter family protein [Planctomycetes bacterium]|nr:VIT1/CCC1 transporter family protein [Planctomycetota bacterium]
MKPELRKHVLAAQRNEITEYHIYSRLAKRSGNERNRKILEGIAADELKHHDFWKTKTGIEVRADVFRIWIFTLIARLLGLSFALKLMERAESLAGLSYDELALSMPGVEPVADDENRHEAELLDMLDEEHLKYVGSIVLGLNDALVELTGALAGLTLALPGVRMVALTGMVTGIAASLSMAASEYLSTKADDADNKPPLKAALYTGSTYIVTVFLLVTPYLVFSRAAIAFVATLTIAAIIILLFNFYVSVAKNQPFWKRFMEMALVSLGVAAISFGVGYLARLLIGTEA